VQSDGQLARAHRSSPPDGGVSPQALPDVELRRLRWRCRRGLLENDLILERFLAARGEVISTDEVAALDRLLDLADNDLWDLLSGRSEPEDTAVRPLVEQLRAM